MTKGLKWFKYLVKFHGLLALSGPHTHYEDEDVGF